MIKTLTLDCETTGLDPWHDKILLIGYRYDSTGPVQQVKIYNGEIPDKTFTNALADPNVVKRGHNTHYDLLCLSVAGYVVSGPIDDTRILSYLQDPNQELNLKTLVETKLNRKVVRMEDFGRVRIKKHSSKYLSKNTDKYNLADHDHQLFRKNIIKSGKYWVSKKTLETYNQADVINCDDLRRDLISTKWYRDVEQPLSSVLFNAEQRGIQLDIPYLQRLNEEFQEKIRLVKSELGTDFNPASPIQVKQKFQEKGLSLENTDRYTLKKICWAEPDSIRGRFARTLLEFRGLSKLCGTYVQPLLEQADHAGRIHGRFNQAGRESLSSGDVKGTATGRLSSSDPNLQNIPKRTDQNNKIRRGFIKSTGMINLIESDLSQIEPRLIAHYSQSRVLLNAYEKGLDTHAIMGSGIFNKRPEELSKLERFIGKTSWLATVYGCYYKKLRQIVEMNSEEPIFYDDEFYKNIQESFWKANPEIRSWRTQHIQQVKNTGVVETIGGRVIKIKRSPFNNFYQDSSFEREAVNYLIQGSAADIMKLIIVRLAKEWKGVILGTVHDSILGEISETSQQSELHYLMTQPVKLYNVELAAKTVVGPNWMDML